MGRLDPSAQSGALLLFAFFMISDPMTTPSHPKGRAAHAALVAAIAYAWGFGLFRTNGLIWALFIAAPMRSAVGRDLARAQIRMDVHAGKHRRRSRQDQGGINGIDDIRKSRDSTELGESSSVMLVAAPQS